jgi:hypothetical protein
MWVAGPAADPDHKVRRHVAELEAAGYAVTLTPAA